MPNLAPTDRTYGEVQRAYEHFNRELFDGVLPSCLIVLQREKRTYGHFSSKRFGAKDGSVTDEIALNPEYWPIVPLVEVLQTLVHEMAHQWQWHHGKPSRACYHNREWAHKMQEIGLMPSSTGQPGGATTGDKMADYPLPGGAFLRAVEGLLANGFGLTWYDRHPPREALYSPPPLAVHEAAPAAAMAVPADDGLTVEIREPAAGLVGRSNRVRYSCSGCGLNAWGKPALRLACVECEVQLQADMTDAAPVAARTRASPNPRSRPNRQRTKS